MASQGWCRAQPDSGAAQASSLVPQASAAVL